MFVGDQAGIFSDTRKRHGGSFLWTLPADHAASVLDGRFLLFGLSIRCPVRFLLESVLIVRNCEETDQETFDTFFFKSPLHPGKEMTKD